MTATMRPQKNTCAIVSKDPDEYPATNAMIPAMTRMIWYIRSAST